MRASLVAECNRKITLNKCDYGRRIYNHHHQRLPDKCVEKAYP